jgi:hypothetical protein
MAILALGQHAVEDSGRPIATVFHGNLLRASPGEVVEGSMPVVAWSGWLGEDADESRGVFARDFRTWTKPAWAEFDGAIDRVVPELVRAGTELWLRPHSRHFLADPQTCVSFLLRRLNQPIRVLLDPASMLTSSMLARAEDHLERALTALAVRPGVAAVLLANVERPEGTDDGEALVAAPLHRGLMEPGLVAAAWRRHGAGTTPAVLIGREMAQQVEVLGRAGSEAGRA